MTCTRTLKPRRLVPIVAFAVALAACNGDPTAPTGTVYERRFEDVWRRVDEVYALFGVKGVNWDSVGQVYRPRAATLQTQAELASLVEEILRTLRDGHEWIVRPDGTRIATYPLTPTLNWDQATWLRYVRDAGWHQGQSNWGWARFGDVGYLAIGTFDPTRIRAADVLTALDSLRQTRALIVDVRMNGGGNSALSDSIAARFADAARVWGYYQVRNGPRHDDLTRAEPATLAPRPWRYDRAVYLLTGRGCFSSTEMFVSAMREYPQVTVVGDTTGGSTGNPGFYSMGEGWQFTVSRTLYYDAQRRIMEDAGIPPDVVVPATPADFARGVDPVLDYALARARAGV
jgi:hypothetical protein